MEATKFFNLLRKHRFTLIAVPLLVGCIAFVLLRKSPETYASRATLSAGIVEQSQQLLNENQTQAESKAAQEFSNLLQMLQMKMIVDQVSYRLILHDLTDSTPFRLPSKLIGTLNAEAKKHAIEVYSKMYAQRKSLSLLDKDQKGMIDVVGSVQYDKDNLTKKLKAYRIENSDFITVEYESESAALSAFVVNSLCEEFVTYYTKLTKENEKNTILYLDTLLIQKKRSLDARLERLKDYKIKNHILSLDDQTKSLYGQITDFESKIQSVEKDIDANEGAIKGINQKFTANDSAYMEASMAKINRDILQNKDELNRMNDTYIKSGFDVRYKMKMDSLKKVLDNQIEKATDKYIENPLVTKENLINQKLNLEVQQDLAKNSLHSLQQEITNLDHKFNALVPNKATIEAYQGDIDIASKEYLDVLNRFNQSSLEYNSSVKLKIIETASPGKVQSSKKILLVGMSAIGSFVFCLLILFVIYYLDNAITSPQELADKTGAAVLGHMPLLKNLSTVDLKQLWAYKAINKTTKSINKNIIDYKNQLRSARFEIDNVIHNKKLLNITSLSKLEGKTIFSICLASAYLMTNKKVLLIDGNFLHPSITEIMKPEIYIEDYLSGKMEMPRTETNNEFIVLGNRGADSSLFEINNENSIRQKLQALKEEFDVVFIESPALDNQNKSKEWNIVVDNIIAVYEGDKAMTSIDKQNLTYLKSQNGKFIGWIMNKVTPKVTEKNKGRAQK